MTDIKVGQVWGFGEDGQLIITNIFYKDISVIFNDGSTDCDDNACWLLEGGKLIAEYPTWIEAINSKEFKGE